MSEARAILLHPDIPGALEFREVLASLMLEFRVALSIDDVGIEAVEIAVIWFRVPEHLQRLPNLRLILVCGSGVDHIIDSATLPRHVRLVRLVDPYLREHVADYVVQAILRQALTRGRPVPGRAVGLMGLGLVGEATAKKLSSMGFDVCAWVRTSRPRVLSEVYVGEAELGAFARRCDVLVCQLPLTPETRGVLSSRLFDQLPQGAFVINVGRGGHLNEGDLLAALEADKLSGACLDVFEVEPLPADHPFRFHPKITVTPHVAGGLMPRQQALHAASVIAGTCRGEIPTGVVDHGTRY